MFFSNFFPWTTGSWRYTEPIEIIKKDNFFRELRPWVAVIAIFLFDSVATFKTLIKKFYTVYWPTLHWQSVQKMPFGDFLSSSKRFFLLIWGHWFQIIFHLAFSSPCLCSISSSKYLLLTFFYHRHIDVTADNSPSFVKIILRCTIQ